MSDGPHDASQAPPAEPVLRVVSGEATAEEVVALVTALAAAVRRQPPVVEQPGGTSRWADRSAALRAPLTPGPGAWQAAGWRP